MEPEGKTAEDYRKLGDTLFDEDPQGALAAYQQATALAPGHISDYNQIGRLLYVLQDYAHAEQAFAYVAELALEAGDEEWHRLSMQNVELARTAAQTQTNPVAKEVAEENEAAVAEKAAQDNQPQTTGQPPTTGASNPATSAKASHTDDFSENPKQASKTAGRDSETSDRDEQPVTDQMDWKQLLWGRAGRISRIDFWKGLAILFVSHLLLFKLSQASVYLVKNQHWDFTPLAAGLFYILLTVISLNLFYSLFVLMLKRLHDLGKSGWILAFPFGVGILVKLLQKYSLAIDFETSQGLMIIPGFLLALIFLFVATMKGQPGRNRFNLADGSTKYTQKAEKKQHQANTPQTDDMPVDYTMSRWKRLFSVYGRINQEQFKKSLWLTLPLYIIGTLLSVVLGKIEETAGPGQKELIEILQILPLLFFYPTLAVFAKRFHDTNRSGWYALWSLIPFGYIYQLFHLSNRESHPERTVYDHINPLPDGRPDEMRKGNMFLRHWRGHLKLSTSFWLNTILFPFLVLLTIGLLTLLFIKYITPHIHMGIGIGFDIFILFFILAFMIWQFTGLWRSAGYELQYTDKKFQPIIARLIALIILAGWGSLIYQKSRFIGTEVKIAMGDGELGKRIFYITQNGKELIISGGISYGLVEEVKRKLENNLDISIIRLQGPGGRIAPARRLRKIIAKRKMTTYVAKECYSACTMIFLGGKKRVLHKNGKLGFHRLSAEGMADYEMEPEIAVERHYMAIRGIPTTFINKVFSTPPDKIWVPSHKLLLRTGYVNRITDGTDFGSRALSIEETEKFEKELLQVDAVLAAMKRHDNALYKEYWQKAKTILLTGGSLLSFAELRARYYFKAEASTIATTTNQAALTLLKARLAILQYAQKLSPVLCARLDEPNRLGLVIEENYLPMQLIHAKRAALAEVIRAAHTTPQPLSASKIILHQGKTIKRKILEKLGIKKVLTLQKGDLSSAKGLAMQCQLMITTYETEASMKADEIAPFYKKVRQLTSSLYAIKKFNRRGVPIGKTNKPGVNEFRKNVPSQ